MDPTGHDISAGLYESSFLNLNFQHHPMSPSMTPHHLLGIDMKPNTKVLAAATAAAQAGFKPNHMMMRGMQPTIGIKRKVSSPSKTKKVSPSKKSMSGGTDSSVGDPNEPPSTKYRRKARKNNREKQRRSELNDRFEKLSALLNLGRKSKTEKFTILTEAINLIHGLRNENHELQNEKAELRAELAKLTSCLQHAAFPTDGSSPGTMPMPMHGKDLEVLQGGSMFGMGPLQGVDHHGRTTVFEPTVMAVAATPNGGPMHAGMQVMAAGKGPFTMAGVPQGSMEEDFDIFQ